ncbi:MAG: hypothetical protein ACYC0L_05925 [Thermoleophilia bacterium]
MLRFIKQWPFLTLGLVTFALFLAVEFWGSAEGGNCTSSGSATLSPDGNVISYQESGGCSAQHPALLIPILRVLVIPLLLMRYFEMFTGIGFLPWPLQLLIALPLLFLPYLAADLLIRSIRQAWASRRSIRPRA